MEILCRLAVAVSDTPGRLQGIPARTMELGCPDLVVKILDEDIAVGRPAVVQFTLLLQNSRMSGQRSTSGSKVYVYEDLVFRVTCVVIFE